MRKFSTKSMATITMIAAIYLLLTIIFAPVSFGVIQFRVAEVLVLLCVFSTDMVVAVTLGCFLANTVGVASGANPMVLDIFFGTFATLIAGYLSYKLRDIRIKGYPFPAIIPPIILNGIIIGIELTLIIPGGVKENIQMFFINSGYVALSQIIPCVLGGFLVITLEKAGISKNFT